jgi:hypothetical protein
MVSTRASTTGCGCCTGQSNKDGRRWLGLVTRMVAGGDEGGRLRRERWPAGRGRTAATRMAASWTRAAGELAGVWEITGQLG